MTEPAGVGRPRKWASNAERMRAYRARQRERPGGPLDRSDFPGVALDRLLPRDRVAELTDERDRLWAQIVRLRQQIRDLERTNAGAPPAARSGAVNGLSRAERRRLEREQARER